MLVQWEYSNSGAADTVACLFLNYKIHWASGYTNANKFSS